MNSRNTDDTSALPVDTSISLIVCSFNPCLSRLSRVLDCLDKQVNSKSIQIEIIVVDNRSDPPIPKSAIPESTYSIKLIREETPGLTSARITGFKAAESALIVFVDDDNLLYTDYAETAVSLANEHPNVGVLSAGSILPEYSIPPPANIELYWPYMALINTRKEMWSNVASSGLLPMGAGMVVRRCVLNEYVAQISNNPQKLQTDRDGKSLFAGGDTDIGLAACDIGMGCGIFPTLKLAHVMEEARLNLPYLNQLVRDVTYSTTMVMCRGKVWPVTRKSVVKKLGIALVSSVTCIKKNQIPHKIASWARFRAYRDFVRENPQ